MPSLRTHRLLLAASLLVPAGLFAAAAVHDRATVLRGGQEEVTRSASVLHEHARKVLDTAELALARVDDRVHGLSWEEIAAPETSAFLARLKAPLEQVVSVWVTDASGVVRAGSQPWDPSVGIGEREFFRVQQERDRGTYVGAAFTGKATRAASIAVSRRRSTPDGRFDGTIHLSLSPEYFAHVYAEVAPNLPHAAALVRADGRFLARTPPRDLSIPLAPDSPSMRAIAAQPEGGFFVDRSSLDGEERMYAYRRVADYPIYVVFAAETAVLLARWRENLVLFGAAAAGAAFALLLVSWLALRGFRAERAALVRLRAAMEELRRETASREAAEARVRQAQKMEAVGQLTGGIAHDFNNLLTAVLGNLELLRKRLPLGDERARRQLDTATQGAERGAALTQRLLAFSRSQALKPEVVDLPGLVQGMSDLLRSTLGAGVQVETCFPLHLPPVRVDANQLELALLNLAANARDAMAGSGRLVISAREETVVGGDASRPGELAPGTYAVLGVADTGEGMDEPTLARAAEPFFTTKGVGKGTGLGLSMVHGFAAQSGGWMALSSRKGKGTTVELWLPCAEQAAAPQAKAAAPDDAAGTVPATARRRTVLLVDDDPLVLASTSALLEDMGHAVVEASSGRQALEILRADAKVDLVVTDHSMPGMSGVQLAAELRRLRPRLPVLLATGFADRVEVAAAGLQVVAKPFGQAALAVAVEGCLDAGAAGRVVQFRAR